jgi:hypothetical protein
VNNNKNADFNEALLLLGKRYIHLIPWGLDRNEAAKEELKKSKNEILADGSGAERDSVRLIHILSHISLENRGRLAIMGYFGFPVDQKELYDFVRVFFGTIDFNSKKLDLKLADHLNKISYEKYLSLCKYMGVNVEKAASFKKLLKDIQLKKESF